MTTPKQPHFGRVEAAVSEIRNEVDDKIRSKKVLLFSKTWDPFSAKAKNVLANYNLSREEFEVWEINNDPRMRDIQYHLGDLTGAPYIPRLFINGRCIGGSERTIELHKSGQLAELLKKK